MSKPEEPTKTPAEEWAEFADRLRGLLARSFVQSKQYNGEAAAEGRALLNLMRSGDDLIRDLREFYTRANGKPPPPKEPKK